jgi:hypothetical protein
LKKIFEKFLPPIISAETYLTGSGVDGNEKENVPFSLALDILRYYIWQCKLNKKLPIFSCITEDVSNTINITRKTTWKYQIYLSTVLRSHAGMNRTESEDVTLTADTGAAERVRAEQRAGDAGNDTNCDGDGSSSDEEKTMDSARLLESGAVLHAMSADEGEGDGSDEEMGSGARVTSPQKRRRRPQRSWTHPTMNMIRKDSLLPAVTGLIPLKMQLKITRKLRKNWPPA